VTLTNRLLLFFLATLALVLGGFSATLILIVRMHLHRQSDERLEAALNALVAAIDIGPDGLLEWEPSQRQVKLGPEAFGDWVVWSVSDNKGDVVERSKQPHAEALLAEMCTHLRARQRSMERLELQGEHWQCGRQWIQPSQQKSGSFDEMDAKRPSDEKKFLALSITAGIPLGPVHTALRQLAGALIGLSGIVWLLALFAGRAVCRRALLPVTRMAKNANEISAANLEQRLPTLSSNDELEELSRAINGLLDRLQDSFERQRRFSGDASHQLRTPIAAILGQIEVALRQQRSPDEYERVLAIVHEKAERLRHITESLLFLARSDNEAPAPDDQRVDLRQWLPEYLQSWSEHKRGKDIGLEQITGEDSCVVAAQSVLLAELLDNLIDNACKYSLPGSPIRIALRRESQSVDVRIEDHGWGIADDELPSLFRPFFRSVESRRRGIGGVGLGLSIAKRLATIFRADLTVTSCLGQGSYFTLRFPLAQANHCCPFDNTPSRELREVVP
jgi:heavy metal sensor kinase